MAYLSARDIVRMEDRYGQPRAYKFAWDIEPGAFTMVRQSQKHGRAHDVTLFIFTDDHRLALIRKHMHPPGAFRAPSGGVDPGEPMERGALREAKEETGLDVELLRYVARFLVTFTSEGKRLEWRSEVFTARRIGGTLATQDPREIAEVGLFTLDELQGVLRARMLAAGVRLLDYRVHLTDTVVSLLDHDGGTSLPAQS